MYTVDKNQSALLIPTALSSRSLIQIAPRALWNQTTSLSWVEVIILSDLSSKYRAAGFARALRGPSFRAFGNCKDFQDSDSQACPYLLLRPGKSKGKSWSPKQLPAGPFAAQGVSGENLWVRIPSQSFWSLGPCSSLINYYFMRICFLVAPSGSKAP